MHGSTMVEYRDALKQVAETRENTTCLDGDTLIPHEQKYFEDTCHPNGEGFAFYADKLAAVMRGLLSKSKL